jgi:mono/diheme cytochrome c family protein
VRAAAAVALALAAAACSPSNGLDPAAERGRQIYLSQCVQCHGQEPGQPGAVGPAVAGSSRALLEAKVLRGEYPPAYMPKRPTTVMPPMPQLAPEIAALTAYLN